MHYEMCSRTDTGRVRSNNEDAMAIDGPVGLCVLADGMGGCNAGEVASGMAVSWVEQTLGPWLRRHPQASAGQLRQAIEVCVHDANHAIYSAAGAHPGYAGMGTTLVVGVFVQNRLLLGHLGDSRCYRLRGHTLAQQATVIGIEGRLAHPGSQRGEQFATHHQLALALRELAHGRVLRRAADGWRGDGVGGDGLAHAGCLVLLGTACRYVVLWTDGRAGVQAGQVGTAGRARPMPA